MSNIEKKYLKYKLKYTSLIKNRQNRETDPNEYKVTIDDDIKDLDTTLQELNNQSSSEDTVFATNMTKYNEANLIWLNTKGIHDIDKIKPLIPPDNLSLEDLQNEMFQNDDKKANYSDDIVNNLKRLWYIYCVGTFPHRVYVPAVKDELKEDELKKFRNEPVVFEKSVNDHEVNDHEVNDQEVRGGAMIINASPLISETKWSNNNNLTTTRRLRLSDAANILTASHLLCSSAPHQSQIGCLQKLAYWGLTRDIKRLLTFEIRLSREERTGWNYISTLDTNNFQFHKELIDDMHSGRVNNFVRILNFLTDPFSMALDTVFHCIGGWGRTGSIVLFLALYQHTLHGRYDPGLPYAKTFFTNMLIDTTNIPLQTQEVFRMNDLLHARLLIQRINIINIVIAYKFDNANICLYKLPNAVQNNNDLTFLRIVAKGTTTMADFVLALENQGANASREAMLPTPAYRTEYLNPAIYCLPETLELLQAEIALRTERAAMPAIPATIIQAQARFDAALLAHNGRKVRAPLQ